MCFLQAKIVNCQALPASPGYSIYLCKKPVHPAPLIPCLHPIRRSILLRHVDCGCEVGEQGHPQIRRYLVFRNNAKTNSKSKPHFFQSCSPSPGSSSYAWKHSVIKDIKQNYAPSLYPNCAFDSMSFLNDVCRVMPKYHPSKAQNNQLFKQTKHRKDQLYSKP